jgi:hypothetical protein
MAGGDRRTGVALAFVVVGIVVLFTSNRSAIDANRDLACRIGAFFVGQPIVKQPEQTQADFEQTVRKAESFLRALRSQDCTNVKGAAVTPAQIHHALRNLHHAAPRGGGRSSGSSPPSTDGERAIRGAAQLLSLAAQPEASTEASARWQPSTSTCDYNHDDHHNAPGSSTTVETGAGRPRPSGLSPASGAVHPGFRSGSVDDPSRPDHRVASKHTPTASRYRPTASICAARRSPRASTAARSRQSSTRS